MELAWSRLPPLSLVLALLLFGIEWRPYGAAALHIDEKYYVNLPIQEIADFLRLHLGFDPGTCLNVFMDIIIA